MERVIDLAIRKIISFFMIARGTIYRQFTNNAVHKWIWRQTRRTPVTIFIRNPQGRSDSNVGYRAAVHIVTRARVASPNSRTPRLNSVDARSWGWCARYFLYVHSVISFFFLLFYLTATARCESAFRVALRVNPLSAIVV